MKELVHERHLTITDVNGALYDRVRVYAELQETGRWGGIIEFAADSQKALGQVRRVVVCDCHLLHFDFMNSVRASLGFR